MKDWKRIHKTITSSTNDDAIAYSAHSGSEKFVITAEQQTRGRGRRGRGWIGQEGNLFASLGVQYPLSQCGELAFIVSLALTQSILEVSPQEDVKIKWPNDVLVRGKKISGILIEKGEGDYLIIGIGINIKSAPLLSNVAYQAISLRDVGISVSCDEFIARIIKNFDDLLYQRQHYGFSAICQTWQKFATGIGQEIRIMQEQTEKRGIFSGVDDNGLLLLDRDGKVEKISAGDIFILNKKEKDYK